jgi:peptidoglycan/LPS O-acetylase OafA/YrhL
MSGTSESRNLDLLRSAAVVFVVVYHLLLFFQSTALARGHLYAIGHWGVLLFFVHTSLVLMFSLERQVSHSPNNGLFGPFYARRLFRIFPLSVVVVLAVYLLHLPVAHLHDGGFRAVHLNLFELLSNLLLVQNITHTDSIIAPLWSLPYEMQIYLVLPVLFLIAHASRSAFKVSGIWILSVLAAALSLKIHRYQISDLLIYLPCFVAGVIAYKLTESRTWDWPFFGWPLMLAALTADYLRGPTLLRGWVCCLLLALAIPQFREMRAGWLSKMCQVVSRYSYGIYLTHFIAIWFAFVNLHSMPMAFRWIAFLVTLVIFPVLLYHTVESPMIALGRRWAVRTNPMPNYVATQT